ncbi:MAG: hypothetical protein M1308_14995, partial [Actinobacteria bacterium]|nr:hypothetical protein [Actinomycetota bacterium]
YERFEKIKKQRAKISSFSTSKFDKPAVTLGGYKLNVGGGIYDESKAEFVEVGNQDASVVVDYPFPGKFPSLEKKQIILDPISWAEDFSSFLKACPVEIEPNELIVGDGHWIIWNLKGRKFYNATKLAFLRNKANNLGADGGGWGRACPDFNIGFSLGYEGILKKIEKYSDKFQQQGKEKEVEYLQAAKMSCIAMSDLIKEYAKKAKSLFESEQDVEIKKIYEKVAKACKNICTKPPTSFYEALLWISFYAVISRSAVGLCGGLARLDTILKPFYDKDIESKRITKEEAQELVAEFMLRRPLWYSIGGRDKNLKDATNEVSWLFLNACDMFHGFTNLGVLWHEDINKDFFRRACEILIRRGEGTPMLMNQDTMIKSVINYGIKKEDAWNVAYNGCAWYAVPGKEYRGGDNAGINLSKCLMNALDLAFKISISSFDEIWDLFTIEVEEAFKALKDLVDEQYEQVPKIWPEIPHSFLAYDCIEKGRDITDLGVKYNSPTIQAMGLSNTSDSLVAIKKKIFEDKAFSLDDLQKALKNNFVGYKDIYEYLLNCPKFGNDDDEADSMAINVVNLFRETISKYKTKDGFSYKPALWSHVGHVYSGKIIGAMPDGKKAEEPLAQGPNPMHGRNTNGVTATARSMSKLEPEKLLECPYQLELDPSFFASSADKPKQMDDLVTSCFKMGLSQVQGNIFTVEQLKEALKNPAEYRNLLVRVTGFSARFVELDKETQAEVIHRYRQTKN